MFISPHSAIECILNVSLSSHVRDVVHMYVHYIVEVHCYVVVYISSSKDLLSLA